MKRFLVFALMGSVLSLAGCSTFDTGAGGTGAASDTNTGALQDPNNPSSTGVLDSGTGIAGMGVGTGIGSGSTGTGH